MSNANIQRTVQFWYPSVCWMGLSKDCISCHINSFQESPIEDSMNYEKCNLKLHQESLTYPYNWKTPKHVYVNPTSDLFLDRIPNEFILKVFNTISETPMHNYRILTSRPERMLIWLNTIYKKPIPDNILLGVTVDNDEDKNRINLLKHTVARIKFVCFTPQITDIELAEDMLHGIDYVMIGCESVEKSDQLEKRWIKAICNMCINLGIPFYKY